MRTFGAYKSVNILPHFADAVAEHGPYDPKVMVNIRLSRDGRYTIEGVDAFESGMIPKFKLDLKYFVNNTINGVTYVSNGQLQIDANGFRYIIYISDAGNGNFLPYSVLMLLKDSPTLYSTQWVELPSDHPFLQAFKRV